jgi:hypothetical protein
MENALPVVPCLLHKSAEKGSFAGVDSYLLFQLGFLLEETI